MADDSAVSRFVGSNEHMHLHDDRVESDASIKWSSKGG
jgi:hypothetical protein